MTNVTWPVDTEFCIVDFETTGLFPFHGDRVVEYAYIIVKNGLIIERGEELINPLRRMSPEASAANNISDEMLEKKPHFVEVGRRLWEAIDNRILIAHNANFDVKFFANECMVVGWTLPNYITIDSLKLSRTLWPHSSNHKLETLAEKAGHQWSGDSHRAMADVEALFTVLTIFFSEFGNRIDTKEKLFHLAGIDKIKMPNSNKPNSKNALELIQKLGKSIEIIYTSRSSGKSTRKITPERVFFSGKSEFLDAFCHKNNEIRTFNIGRINEIIPNNLNLEKEVTISLEHREFMDTPREFDEFLLKQLADLENDNPQIRANAAFDFQHYTDTYNFTLSNKMRKRIVDKLILCLGDIDPNVRRVSAYSLGYFGSEVPAIPLIQCLSDVNDEVVEYAIVSLISLEKTVPHATILEILNHDSGEIRLSALRLLCNIAANPDAELIIPLLSDDDHAVAAHAAEILGRIKDINAIEPLISLLGHESEYVKLKAAQALALLGDDRAIEPLLSLLESEVNFHSSSAAITLGEIREKQAVEPIIKLIWEKDEHYGKEVLFQALGEIGDERAVLPIRVMSSRYDETAIEALSKIGGEKSKDSLETNMRNLYDEIKNKKELLKKYKDAIEKIDANE